MDENYFAWNLFHILVNQCVFAGMGDYIGINVEAFTTVCKTWYGITDSKIYEDLWRKIQVIDSVRKTFIQKKQDIEKQKHSSGGSRYGH